MSMIKFFGKPIRLNKVSSERRQFDVGASLFIGNLAPDVDEKILYDTFSSFGTITQTPKVNQYFLFTDSLLPLHLSTNELHFMFSMNMLIQISREMESGLSKGYGFISFESFESADAAILGMNGQFLMNKAVTLSYAYKKDGKGEMHGSVAGNIPLNFIILIWNSTYFV